MQAPPHSIFYITLFFNFCGVMFWKKKNEDDEFSELIGDFLSVHVRQPKATAAFERAHTHKTTTKTTTTLP